MLSWGEFDQAVAEGIRRNDPSCVDKSPDGGLKCPLVGHDHDGLLPWQDGGYRHGTQPDTDHSFSFRVSPTFIYSDPLDNFIAGRDLMNQAINGEWGKADPDRFDHENSEDALSWNVFRSLQEAGQLPLAVNLLTGLDVAGEPDLIFWGRRIPRQGTDSEPSHELSAALADLEPTLTRHTEPDIVLHLPDWGWLFIEAKFGSENPTYAGKPERVAEWTGRYSDSCPGLFDEQALHSADAKTFPQQILRNIAVASKVRGPGDKARVVSLVPRKKQTDIEQTVKGYLEADAPVDFEQASWEGLYEALPDDEGLAPLRRYMEEKSAGLGRAFDISADL